MNQQNTIQQYAHKSWAFVKRGLDALYLVAVAFIVGAVVFSILPTFQNPVGQIIVGALFGAGLTIFVTKITAQQSILEQYKKEASLNRKRDVYRPLYAELREIRENLDKAREGLKPYPLWIKIEGDDFEPSFYQTGHNNPPTFSFWPLFKKNNVVDDDFTEDVQYLLDEVQRCIGDYNETYKFSCQDTQNLLKQNLDIAIKKVEQSQQYQEWLQKRDQEPYIKNGWFEFIHRMVSPSLDAALNSLSNSWIAQTSGWLIAGKAEQAVSMIYGVIRNMGITDLLSNHLLVDIFKTTLNDDKIEYVYRQTMDTQDKLCKKLLEAEKKIKDAMIEIRDRYQGGPPPL